MNDYFVTIFNIHLSELYYRYFQTSIVALLLIGGGFKLLLEIKKTKVGQANEDLACWNILNGAFYYIVRVLFTIFSRKGIQVLDTLTAWWPVLLIILGAEVLLYLLFSKKEQSFIKYDIFSIFFIGVLGSVGIAFTVYYQLDY